LKPQEILSPRLPSNKAGNDNDELQGCLERCEVMAAKVEAKVEDDRDDAVVLGVFVHSVVL
jgi:hypothetical protein